MELVLQRDWQTVAFLGITLAWWLEFVLFPSPASSQDNQDKVRERQSFRRIMTAVAGSIALSALLTLWGRGLFAGEARAWIRTGSVFIYGLGLLFRYGSLLSLGRHFSRDVEVGSDQELISTGFYRYIRHPLYLGLFLLTIAVPLFMGNAMGFLVAAAAIGVQLNQRMQVEEDLMEEVMGERYRQWKQARFRFIPFVF